MSFVAAALAMGLLGNAHCLAMCGGIAAAPSFSSEGEGSRALRTLLQNAGRLASYSLAGAAAGAFGAGFAAAGGSDAMFGLRTLAALLLLAAGLQVGGWAAFSARLEALGGRLWRRLAPLARRARQSQTLAASFGFGLLWGWLPCGLVYSALVLASTSGSAPAGAATLLAFGAGTLPGTLLVAGLASRGFALLRGPASRRVAGASLAALGVWTFVAAASSWMQPAAACHH